MKLHVDHMPGTGSVACGLFLPVGAATEHNDQQGLSHFLEHLIFKGSKKRSAKDIAIEIDGTGGDLNAYTSVELTSFYGKVLHDDLDLVMDILFDIAYNPILESDAIELERGVVLSEIAEFMDAPDEIASVRAFQAAWGDDPLARSVLGSVDVIKTVTSEKIRKYHKTHYVPEDTVISVCGNTTYDEMAAKCQKYGIKAEPLDGTSVVVEKAPEFKPRKMAMERDSEQVYFTYCWPGPMISSEEIAECLVLMTILCGSISSRLFQRLREQEGLVYNIATLSSFSKSTGLLGIYGAVPKENFTRSRDILLFELDQFRKNGVSHDELERAKRMIKGSTKLSMESNTARMDRNGKLALLLGDVPGIDQVIGRVMDLKLNYVNKYIGNTVPEDFAVSLVGKGLEGLEGFECE